MSMTNALLGGTVVVLDATAAIQTVLPDPETTRLARETDVLIEEAQRLAIRAGEVVDTVEERHVPFLEIDGRGVVLADGPFTPGDMVPIQFLVRRNEDCRTDIEVRFADRSLNGASNTALTYPIQATRADVSDGFQLFTAQVTLPAHIEPGRYAYFPLIEGKNQCAGETLVALSDYFDVHAKESR